MRFRVAVAFAVALVVLLAGCISSSNKNAPPPKVYVTPCNIASKGVQVKVNSETLNALAIKPELEIVFVDNFKSPAAESIKRTYELNCYWGNNVGENREYYYCAGKYKAPDLDESQIIKRFLWKEFKFGFSVEEHNVGSWVDTTGKTHVEGSVYYLTVKTVDGKCYLA
ncbi:MAG: hypothetical protein V1744_06960 [Candidatus Altiarchaeota archaeon]